VLGAGTAYAYFTATGSATGTADVGGLRPVILASAATQGPLLLPGRTGNVVFSVTNPNNSAMMLVGVALNGSVAPDSSHSGCSTTDGNPVVTLNVPSSDLPVSLPAHSTKMIDLTGAAAMDSAATSNCQGATFSFPLTITVQR
jgi:hypothetical protein